MFESISVTTTLTSPPCAQLEIAKRRLVETVPFLRTGKSLQLPGRSEGVYMSPLERAAHQQCGTSQASSLAAAQVDMVDIAAEKTRDRKGKSPAKGKAPAKGKTPAKGKAPAKKAKQTGQPAAAKPLSFASMEPPAMPVSIPIPMAVEKSAEKEVAASHDDEEYQGSESESESESESGSESE